MSSDGEGSASEYESSSDDDAQEMADRVMENGDDAEEEGSYQVDGLRHLCCLDATPIDEGALQKAMAEKADGLERFLHQAATAVSPLSRAYY